MKTNSISIIVAAPFPPPLRTVSGSPRSLLVQWSYLPSVRPRLFLRTSNGCGLHVPFGWLILGRCAPERLKTQRGRGERIDLSSFLGSTTSDLPPPPFQEPSHVSVACLRCMHAAVCSSQAFFWLLLGVSTLLGDATPFPISKPWLFRPSRVPPAKEGLHIARCETPSLLAARPAVSHACDTTGPTARHDGLTSRCAILLVRSSPQGQDHSVAVELTSAVCTALMLVVPRTPLDPCPGCRRL